MNRTWRTIIGLLVISGVAVGIGIAQASRVYDSTAAVDTFLFQDDTPCFWGSDKDFDLTYTDSDANAVCLLLDMPEGGAATVPVFLLAQDDSDFGYFNGVTQPSLCIEDADGDSYISISFSADDTPAITVGGSASTIAVPGITAYSFTDDVDVALGTSDPASIEWTTADANANCLFVDLPAASSPDVPVMLVGVTDADFGYFNGVTNTTFGIEDADGDSWGVMEFSADDTFGIDVGGSATAVNFVDNLEFGVDGTGIDVKFYGDTADYLAWWDQNGDTNGTWYFGADDYGVDVVWYMQSSDHLMNLDVSANSGDGAFYFGQDNHGVDVYLYGETSGDYIHWDQSIDTLVGVDGNVKLDDDAILYFGTGTNVTTADGDFTVNFSDGSPGYLTLTAVAAEDVFQIGDGTIATDVLIQNTTTAGADIFWDDSAELWKFGVDNTGVDVAFYGDGTGNYIYWDESIDTLACVDGNVKMDDDAILYFGTGTNVTTADGDFTVNFTDGSPGYLTVTAASANDGFKVGDGTVATDFIIDNITTAGSDVWFDQSADTANGAFYFGQNNKGVDVVLYGETDGAEVTWDMSADTIECDAVLDIHDQLGLQMASTSSSWNPGAIAAGEMEAHDITVTGAALGDFVIVSCSLDVSDLTLTADVTNTNTVTCVLGNSTTGSVDLQTATFRVIVIDQH